MKKKEWIKMMEQDIATMDKNKKASCEAVLNAAKDILKEYPENTEIKQDLTVEKIFDSMKEAARKKAVDGFYDFTPHVREFIIKQLGLTEQQSKTAGKVNLEDFF